MYCFCYCDSVVKLLARQSTVVRYGHVYHGGGPVLLGSNSQAERHAEVQGHMVIDVIMSEKSPANMKIIFYR